MAHSLPPFERLGPWRLISLLGEGGMGSVWLAERADGAFQRQVAIKLVGAGAASETLLQRFVAERQTLAELDHPGISRLIDGGETPEGLPYLVMDYVTGVTLDDYCRQQRPNVQARLALFLQICEAVQYAHQRLIVHRDLKPANILVSDSGQPILLDFGIARLLPGHSAAARSSETLDHERHMTPRYAAPEQIEAGTISTATDVYALGVILYELLSGCSPYGSHNTADVITLARAVLDSDPAPPSDALVEADIALRPPDLRLQQRLHGDLDTIVLKALRKQPQRRYASVEQFAEDLQRHIQGLPVRARPDTLAYRAGKFLRRNRWPLAAGTAVLLSLTFGLGIALRQAEEADRQRLAAEQQREQAEQQRNLAEQARGEAQERFTQVRSLSSALLGEVDELLEMTPGTTAIRQRLIEQTLSYLDLLGEEADPDPELQTEIAIGYSRLADLLGSPYSANVADYPRALEMAREGLDLRRQVHDHSPDDVEATLALIASLNQVTTLEDVALLQGQRLGDDALLVEAETLMSRLLAVEPRNGEVLRNQIRLLLQRGHRMHSQEQYVAAEAAYREALAVNSRYTALPDADAAIVKRQRAVAQLSFSGALWYLPEKADEALRQAHAALDAFRQIAAVEPGNVRAQRELALSLSRVASISAEQISIAEALPYKRELLNLSQQLVEQNPDNAQLLRDLAIARSGLALLLQQGGETVESIELLRAAEIDVTALAQRNPEHAPGWGQLAISRCTLAVTLDEQVYADPQWNLPRCTYASGCIAAHARAGELGLEMDYLSEYVIIARAQRVACREQGLD